MGGMNRGYWTTVLCRMFDLKVLDGFGTCHITVTVIFYVFFMQIYVSLMKCVDLCGLQLLAYSTIPIF